MSMSFTQSPKSVVSSDDAFVQRQLNVDYYPKGKKVVRILCLDGGGIRGIIPAIILRRLEEKSGKKISELFDVVSGTSTGGLLSLLAVVPSPCDQQVSRFSAHDMVKLYKEKAGDIFAAPSYTPEQREEMRFDQPGSPGSASQGLTQTSPKPKKSLIGKAMGAVDAFANEAMKSANKVNQSWQSRKTLPGRSFD